jgi:glutamyl-tRNA synthetase
VQEDVNQWVGADTHSLLNYTLHELKALTTFDHDAIADCLKKFCKARDLKLVTVAQPLRLALTGSTASPGIFDLLALVGKEKTIERVATLTRFLEAR